MAPQHSMALLFSPNHHYFLAQRMILPPTRDTFLIPLTAVSSPFYILGGSRIHLGYTSPSLSETHHSLPN